MIKVGQKYVYTTLTELINPEHTAVVVVDMQNDFCISDGVFGRLGIDLSMYESMIPKLAQLLSTARSVHIPVIYIQMTVLPDYMSESPAQLRFNMNLHAAFHHDEPVQYTLEGTPGQKIIAELEPYPGDIIVKKYRSSAFWGTNLNMLLRSNTIETVIMTGCTTEGCVESTARDALFNDYYVVLPEDCVASDDPRQHDASLFLMRHRFDVVSSAEILSFWQSKQAEQVEQTRQWLPTD